MNNSKQKFLTYLFVLLSLFIIFGFTKNIYSNLIENKAQKNSLQETLDNNKQQYQKLSQIKSDIDAGKYNNLNFDKYLVNFSEDEITDYFYSYANANPTKLKIESIGLSPGTPNDFGFKEAKIDLNVTFSSEKDMIDVVNNLIINSNKYNFYIHDLSYPFGNINGPFSISLPIKVLYK